MTEQPTREHSLDAQVFTIRDLKYCGLSLIGIGLVSELAFFFTLYDATLVEIDTIYLGILSCMIGIALYGTAKGNKWVWMVFACAIAIVPLFGPFIAIGYINTPRKLGLTFGIVGAIALILAIAIPNFMMMDAKRRQAEARANLPGLFTAATAMFAERKTYVISDISQLGVALVGPNRYALWYAVNGIPTALNTAQPYGSGCDVTTPPTTVKVAASAAGFTAAAKGNPDGDATCDEWSINEKKELVHTLDDTKD